MVAIRQGIHVPAHSYTPGPLDVLDYGVAPTPTVSLQQAMNEIPGMSGHAPVHVVVFDSKAG